MMTDTGKEFNSCSDVILHLLKLYKANGNWSESSLQAADDEQEWSRPLSNAAGYVVRETRTGKRMLVSFRDAELCNVAVANMYELQFLSAIDALPALLASDIPFRAISTETAEKLERDGHMERLDILYDTRSLELFAPTAKSPRTHAYIGPISNKKAAAVHKLVLCEESRKALGKLLSPDSPMRNFFDMSCNIAEEIANELFCGNARVLLAGKKTKPMASIVSRFDLMPTTSPKICEETRLLNLISDAGDVWTGYIGMLGEDSLLTAIGDPRHDDMWSLPSIGTMRSWFRSFREISGVETGVKALFDGVPVEDIVV